MDFEYWIPAFVCWAAAVSAAFFCCLFYFYRTSALIRMLGRAGEKLGGIGSRRMENAEKAGGIIAGEGDASLSGAWESFAADADTAYGNTVAPEADAYFTYGDLAERPGRGGRVKALKTVLPVLCFAALLAPAAMLFFAGDPADAIERSAAAAAALCGPAGVLAVYLFTVPACVSREGRCRGAIREFCLKLNGCLPTASDATQAAILVLSNRRNAELFAESADRIAGKIEELAARGAVPPGAGARAGGAGNSPGEEIVRLGAAASELAGAADALAAFLRAGGGGRGKKS